MEFFYLIKHQPDNVEIFLSHLPQLSVENTNPTNPDILLIPEAGHKRAFDPNSPRYKWASDIRNGSLRKTYSKCI